MVHGIKELLEGKNRLWDKTEWYTQTSDFLVKQIKKHLNKPCEITEFSRFDVYELIDSYLKSNTVFSKEQCVGIKIAIIFFRTKEFNLADEYLQQILDKLQPSSPEEYKTCAYLMLCKSKILSERADFHSANERLLLAYNYASESCSSEEIIYIILLWISLFIDADEHLIAENLLNELSVRVLPKQDDVYAKLLYLQFINQKKNNQFDSAISWINTIQAMPNKHLDEDDWYTIHLFAGEYFANVKRNFDKSIHHFTFANSFLSLKWKSFISLITQLKDYLKLSDYLKIREAYEDKVQEIILENNLHSNHYLNTLKNAYEELQVMYERVHQMSLTDNLTNLNNRRFLWEKAPEFINLAIAEKVPISSVMIDFDDFKQINDRYGHQSGDEVLKQVSAMIRSHFRKSDLVIRFGGEEVLVLLFNSNSKNCQRTCEELRKKISEVPFSINNKNIPLSVSIGISSRTLLKNKSVKIVEELIEEADMAMYYSKANGKNQLNTYLEIKKIKRGEDGSGVD